jgi:parvulin-like peptidyl-prolyl isomerase
MKKIPFLIALGFTLLLPLAAHAAKPLDEIVAVVEDDVVLRSELNSAMKGSRRQKGESREAHERRVLDQLITNRAQKLAADRAGIKVTDEEVDAAVATIAARNKISVAQLRQILGRQGQSYSAFRENLRKQIGQQKFHQKSLSSQVQVTESEVDDYLSIHGGAGKTKIINQTKARHILLRPGEQLSNKEAKARLTEIRQQIVDGESFESLAQAYSDDTASALKGGDLGWLSPGVATPTFEKQLKQLKKDQISQPFQTPFGWHIAQVLDRRQQKSADTAAREAAKEKIQQRKIEESLDLLARRLRDQAYVEYRDNGFE